MITKNVENIIADNITELVEYHADENTPIIDIRFNCSVLPFNRNTYDLKIVNNE